MHTVHLFGKSCPGRHQKCHLCVWVWVGNGFMLVVPPLGCHRTLNNCLCQGDTDPSQSHRNGLFMLHQNQTNAEIEKSVYTFQSVPGWMARGFTQCMGDKHRVMGRPISFSIALLDHYHRNGPVGLLGSYARICWGLISTAELLADCIHRYPSNPVHYRFERSKPLYGDLKHTKADQGRPSQTMHGRREPGTAVKISNMRGHNKVSQKVFQKCSSKQSVQCPKKLSQKSVKKVFQK